MSPPTVTRSGNSLTQQDSYLTVAKRLGIPTSATDDLDAAVTAQNSIKILYNTTLGELRLYNPVTMTWSSVGGNTAVSNGIYLDGDSIKLGGNLTETTNIDRNNNEFIIQNGSKSIFQLGDYAILSDSVDVIIQSNNYIDLSAPNISFLGKDFDSIDVNFLNLKRKDTVDYILGVTENTNINPLVKTYKMYRTPKTSGGGGGTTYFAKNGIYINSDTIKLGGNITENTKLDNPNSKSIQIGSDGDAMNLNVVPPFPYSGLISSYSGYDYRSAEYMSFIGVLKGLNFPDFGFINQDMVGTFTIVGNPFDSIYPDGSIMIDGVWELGGQVSMNKLVFTFLGSDITFNTISMSEIENTEEIEGDNAIQLKSIVGDNAIQVNSITGDKAIQRSIITGDSAKVSTVINGENGHLSRVINNTTTGKVFNENITDTKQEITVDNIKLNTNLEVTGNVKLSGVTSGIPINTYGIDASGKVVKFNLADYLPKTLVEFRGSASYTGTTSESVVYASPAIPSTAWRVNGNYILTILGVCQAMQTQNAVIKIYLNTTNTLNGSEILINQSHVLTDNTYTPNGGNVLAINLPIFKNTIELLTNKGNSTIANINTGSIFSSNINMTYAKTRTKVTPNFTGNLYLIITTTQSAVSVTTEINNIIFKEI
jgi:hypothetical protein